MSIKAIKDLYTTTQSLPPAARTASTNGTGVSLAGAIEDMAVVSVGTITDGVHTPKLQESVDNAAFTDVAAANQVGAFAPLASNTVQKVSYIGAQAFLRVVVTVTGAPATGGVYGASIVTKPHRQPAP